MKKSCATYELSPAPGFAIASALASGVGVAAAKAARRKVRFRN